MSTHVVDRQTCRDITTDIEAAIAPVLEQRGLKTVKKASSYGPLYGLKLELIPTTAEDPAAATYRAWASLVGLPEDGLGKTITLGGRPFTIVGYNSRARKSPVMIEDPTGRGYKTTVEAAQRALAAL